MTPADTSAIRPAVIGAGAGIVGTLTMSLLMLPARWAGLLGTQPPRRVSDRALQALGLDREVDESERRVGTTVAHLAIGAGAGAVAGFLRARGGRLGPGPVVGAAFGSALWAVNYIVVAPALELFPPPQRDRPGRPPVMFAANVLFGVVTTTLVDLGLRGAPTRRVVPTSS